MSCVSCDCDYRSRVKKASGNFMQRNEDDANFEEDRNYEAHKKFDTRLTRVWSESIEGKGAAALLEAKTFFSTRPGRPSAGWA